MYPNDDYPHDAPAPATVWQRLNRLLGVLIVLAVVAGVLGAFIPQIERQRAAATEEKNLQLLVNQIRKRVEHQSHVLTWLKTDPSYLEIMARDRLDLMKEGETIYRLDPPKTPPPRPAPASETPKPRRTAN